MKQYKLNKKTKPRSFKWFIIALTIFLITLPSNYCGKQINLKNTTKFAYLGKSHRDTLLNSKITTTSKENLVYENNEYQQNRGPITFTFVIFSTITFIISNILLLRFVGYLNDVSFEKQGMLLYLYRDVVKLSLSICWLWMIAVVTCNIAGNGLTMDQTKAKFFGYGFMALGQLLLLTLNAQGYLRCCMMKERMLDPPMPWDNTESERIAPINKVRCSSILLTLLFTVILYASEIYPKVYYNLTGDFRTYFKLPLGTLVISSSQIILFITYTSMAIRSEIYQQSTGSETNDNFPRQINHLLRAILLLVVSFVICAVWIPSGYGRLWVAFQIIISTGGVILPGWMMLVVSPFRSYVARTIRNRIAFLLETLNCIMWYVNIYRSYKQSSTTIVPIE